MVVGWLDSYTVLTIDRIGSILFLKISSMLYKYDVCVCRFRKYVKHFDNLLLLLMVQNCMKP